jgi:prepilin-type N-terminal cleavage/methylation domain-containing protein/prepilin-type processing-associated H-X9-DG protein
MKILSRRSGFTLIELVVVIFISSIMLALMLPLLVKARYLSQRNRCANNLRKIGLYLHDHVNSYGRFPSGVQNPRETPTPGLVPFGYHPWWSWMALATEFYERDVYQVAHDYAMKPGTYYWPWGIPPSAAKQNPVLGMPLPIWICPADDPMRYKRQVTGLVVAYTAYLGVSGIWDGDSRPRTGGPSPVGFQKGVLFLMSKVRLQDIKDGTSNTVMVGERPPSDGAAFGWWFAGAGYIGPLVNYYTGYQGGWDVFSQKGTGDVYLGAREDHFWNWLKANDLTTNDPSCTGPMKIGLQPGGIRGFCDQAHFWSLHPGGAHFLLADGSVRFLSYSQDNILPQLSTRAGND